MQFAAVALFAGAALAAPWADTPANGTALTTKTVYSTKVYTVTSCAPTITNCPAHSTVLKTDIVSITTTVCPVTATPVLTQTTESESTVYSTEVVTITSCAASITNCPAHSTVAVSTIVPSVVPASVHTFVTLLPAVSASVRYTVPAPSVSALASVSASQAATANFLTSVLTQGGSTIVETIPVQSATAAPVASVLTSVLTQGGSTIVETIPLVPTSSPAAVAQEAATAGVPAAVAQEAATAGVPAAAPVVSGAPAASGVAAPTTGSNTTFSASPSPASFTGAASSLSANSLVLAAVAVFGAMLAL